MKKPWYIAMLDPFMKIINWFAASADNSPNGPSGRKFTAIAIMALIIHGHLKYVDKTNFYNVLIVYVVFVCVLLGIVTVEQIIKLIIRFFETKETKNETPKDPLV
jgi:hypothetical protein